jgi:DNA-binding transcriptional LysR family regulator
MRDLNDLNLYAAVVANGGFSAAARALNTPKSRISRRVAALESQLGVRLVERSTRRFKVTEVGQDVYRHARAALCEAEAIDEVVSRLKAEPQGLVRVSCPLGIDRVLGPALPPFLERNPKLRVQVIVANRRVDLINEGVDVAIRIREQLDGDADLQVRTIGRTGGLLVASPAFIAAHGHPKRPADFTGFPTIAHTEAALNLWSMTGPNGEHEEIIHEPRVSANDWVVIRQAVLGGLGIAMLPEYVARELIASGQLVRVLPDWVTPQGILHLVFTSRRGMLPGVRAFIDFAVEALRPSDAWASAF